MPPITVAPTADFVGELERMKLVQTRFQAVPVDGTDKQASFLDQAEAAELVDLAAALKKANIAVTVRRDQIRISPSVFNNQEDIDKLLRVLSAV